MYVRLLIMFVIDGMNNLDATLGPVLQQRTVYSDMHGVHHIGQAAETWACTKRLARLSAVERLSCTSFAILYGFPSV